MDANEIAKQLPELAKLAMGSAAAKVMFGPVATEVARQWEDRARLWRFGKQVDCVAKAEKLLKDAGIKPQSVQPKILLPLLEGASFEENEDLQDMWAALLANAASPDHAESVRPGFIAILKEMAVDEAKLLEFMYKIGINDKLKQAFKEETGEEFDDLQLSSKRGHHATYSLPMQHYGFFARSLGDMGFGSSDSVKSFQQLIDRSAMCLDRLDSTKLISQHDSHGIQFTVLGIAFIEACQPPKPKA